MNSSDPITRLNAALEGRYRIERQLGEGGMATVYLADDLKHERKVALKVLKPELAAAVGADRFLAEIKTTANLQHPHILPLFDSGEADGFLFYVMPYVQGESLRDRLDRERQLPVDEAVQIARNVAEALDYAHRQSVVHRDIKPANILLQDGKPVVSDFGIALAVRAGGGRLTETGLSLGTPHYMSPEQATGDVGVGAATDIYALGCVLYDMLVGEPPFTGSTPQAVLGKIITGEPASATQHRRAVPANVDATIRKALEKVPADRFRRAQDFAHALSDGGFRYGRDAVAGGGRAASPPWRVAAISAMAVAGALAAGLVWTLLKPQSPRAVTRVSILMPEDESFNFARGDLDLSRDGSLLVYVRARDDGRRELWARRLDELHGSRIGDTDQARLPVISPDGREVAFQEMTGGPLRVVPIYGGVSRTLLDEPICCPSWSPDGAWIYYMASSGGLARIPSTGGVPESVTEPDAAEGVTRHIHPEVLPDARRLVYEAVTADGPVIQAVDLSSGVTKTLIAGHTPRYSTTGHLLLVSVEGTTLLSAPFDLDDLELTGPAVPIATGLLASPAARDFYAVSQTGRLIYRSGIPGGGGFTPVWVERDGVARAVDPLWSVPAAAGYASLALSADGTRLALPIRGGEEGSVDVWVKQLDTGPLSRVTFEGTLNGRPVWAPDQQSLTFPSSRNGRFDLLRQRADGTGEAAVVLDSDHDIYEALYSPDGAWLVYREETDREADSDLYAMRVDGDGGAIPLAATNYHERSPAFSPDGRWLAFTSDFTGRDEVYVIPFPPTGASQRVQVSRDGGTEPLWAHNGSELFYRNSVNQMVVVSVEVNPTFRPDRQQALFSTAEYLAADGHALYDVTQDDERFVMLRSRADATGSELILVDNWAEELVR